MKPILQLLAFLLLLPLLARAQVNSGSTGADGAFNPTTNTVINMADHPDGIYHYTSVNIPAGVTVSFIPNAGNKPVVWLVQGDCVVNGVISIGGYGPPIAGVAGVGGPGGWAGGNGGSNASPGQGPGSGAAAPGEQDGTRVAQGGSYATQGGSYNTAPTGSVYGNSFLLPLLGGSGGGGSVYAGGGGGGGAILIAASNSIGLYGAIYAYGGPGGFGSSATSLTTYSGGGSGGGVRLVAYNLAGNGTISVNGGNGGMYQTDANRGGFGRVRFDTYANNFGGQVLGTSTQGFQPIIIPAPGQGIQLTIQSVGGVAVAANPSGALVTPDAIISGQQANPVAIVVRCTNLPLGTPVTVTVKPANGASISAVGYNNTGTLASSTATVNLNMPRGGGIIYATAATGN